MTYHIGPCSFSADGRQVYFAFTPVPENAPKKPKKTVVYTGLYFSELDSAGRWSKPAALPFNKPMYAATDPFISDDGRTLYFSANYPGGAGGMDLYAVNRRTDGGWDTPQNLRAANTAGNERTPVALSGQTLYFASDGHPGIGGLDIFRLRHDSIVNLGYPINSPQDDLNYTPSDSAGVAWFSSNRYNGLGADDIYRAYTPPPPPDDNYVYRSQVVDAQGNSIANARVVVKEAPLQTTSDANGDFLLPLKKQQKYEVQLLEQGRVAGLQQVNEDGSSTPAKLVKVEPNRRFRINIHYDYKDSTFRDEDRASLDELVAFLNTFPSVSIAVASHTDSRGDDAYNLRLSQQRAESIVTYLVSKGIDRARLNPVGYGETRLLNKCANGVTCTEEEHQQNRRAEFWVTKQ
ncbi:OmpA family protein [Chitinophaga sedimenti]|uniref:OmpA family protein n=1 Tax=Chitinophaga sedimenti TaxID=2033606 RepID=UPI00200629F7|nr:OmpA family protein [Chitinophaga sedimenti]MCK7555985.1 OmpA family protein [Chitinophaga sedimenti]